MFADGRTLPADHVVRTDVCVVGAGPAGITIARELAGLHHSVCLIESGGLELDDDVLALADGESSGDPFPHLRNVRHRQYGGMSSQWDIRIRAKEFGVRYAPLDAIDFEARDWVPSSGWPFLRDHLIPFYERAQRICGLGPFEYEPGAWETPGSRRIELEGNTISTSVFQFGRRDVFLRDSRIELSASPNVTVFLNASLIELETDDRVSAVRRAHFACLSGSRFVVEARIFILAMGAIENARLLLLSNGRQRHGLGNQHDVVGRYFIEHPLVETGTLYPAGGDTFRRMTFYDLRIVNGTPVMAKFQLSCAAMRRHRLLNMSAILLPRNKAVRDSGARTEATHATKAVLSSLRRGKLPERAGRRLATVATGFGGLIGDLYRYKIRPQELVPDLDQGGWSLLRGFERRFSRFEVISQTEQAPDPENRVVLDSSLDAFGRARPRLIYRWNEIDRNSVSSAQRLIGEQFARAGLGRLSIHTDVGRPKVVSLSTHHCMGTTRMNQDPRHGVVNADGRVHDVANLFIAGSSVFPTGGYANPTLTIVALAVRLADHVKARLQHG